MTTKLQPPAQVEQITIKAGEMTWEEWQPHFERMSGATIFLLIANQDVAVDKEGSSLEVYYLKRITYYPITFNQAFTYTPVYPLWQSDPVDRPKPQLEVGRVYETWEELEELVNAWGLTNENSAYCLKDAGGNGLSHPLIALECRSPFCVLPWTLVARPDCRCVPSDAPLKSFVWVEGNRLPVKSHDTHEQALQEALRLGEKERKRVFVITAVVDLAPQIVELGE